MQKQTAVAGNGVMRGPRQFAADLGAKAIDVVQAGANRATTTTEKSVRKHPLASMGIAFGSGVAAAVIGYLLLSNRHPERD